MCVMKPMVVGKKYEYIYIRLLQNSKFEISERRTHFKRQVPSNNVKENLQYFMKPLLYLNFNQFIRPL